MSPTQNSVSAQEPLELQVLQPALGEKIRMISNEGSVITFRSEGLQERCSTLWFLMEVNGAEIDRMTYCHCENLLSCYINMHMFHLNSGNVSLVLKVIDDRGEVKAKTEHHFEVMSIMYDTSCACQRTACFCRYNFNDLHKRSLVCNPNSSCELKASPAILNR